MTDLFNSPTASLNTTIVFALALCANLLLKFWLAGRQVRHVALNRDQVPAAFATKIKLAAHQKAADYTIAKTRFGLIELAWGAAIVVAWTLLGGLSTLNHTVANWFGNGLTQQIALLAAFVAIGSVLDLPFTLYQTFVITCFGFNKTSLKLWLQDFAKSLVVGLIGLHYFGDLDDGRYWPWWWLWVWGWLASACWRC
jgi:STE24 endopeptidase